MDIVEKEWQDRIANNLPPYHSINDQDIGFIFNKPTFKDVGTQAFIDGDYDLMERTWTTSSAIPIQQITTLKQLPLKISYSLPKVEHLIKTPQADFISYLFCDGLYFKKFGAKLAITIKENLHVHLMDADPSFAKYIIEEHNLKAGLSVEQPEANPEYYHSIRFIRWYEYMKETKGYSCLLDVDALANKPPDNLPQVDVGMRLRPARLEPWNVCNASVCIGKANQYWKGVADYIYHFYKQDKLVWQIDQLALWAVWQKQKNKIHTLGELEVSYDYDDEGIIWCNSGKNKWKKTDPTRQKYRIKSDAIKLISQKYKKELKQLESKAKNELKNLNLQEAERLYLRLLRRCFENLPHKPPFTETVEKQERRVEKILYLPVEISARELASREWIAKQMKGWKVVIGNRWQMQNWNDLPCGVILWKSANTQDVGVFVDAINAGHLICLMDEELFPMRPLIDLYKPSLDKKCLEYADVIFAHSKEQKKLYEQLTKTPVEVTGNPRSLLATKAKGGDRVVICTMCGTLNNYGRTFEDMIYGTVKLLGGASHETFDFLAYQITHEIKGYGLLRQAISELKDVNPLIRCHPSEDISFWKGYGELDDRTPFMQRLDNSRCIVYVSGCGTGLEATLAGIPTVRLGEGGHGLSAEIGQGIDKNILNGVTLCEPQFKPIYSEVTLPDAIQKLQLKHSFKCDFNLEKAYEQIYFQPLPFHKNKFPKDPEGKLIGWRTVLCQP